MKVRNFAEDQAARKIQTGWLGYRHKKYDGEVEDVSGEDLVCLLVCIVLDLLFSCRSSTGCNLSNFLMFVLKKCVLMFA